MTNNKNLFSNFFSNFTCKYYSELVSKSIDTKLSTKESIYLKLHHVLCLLCRRCKTQIDTIEKACCSMAKENELIPNSKKESSRKLSEECKNKIKQDIK